MHTNRNRNTTRLYNPYASNVYRNISARHNDVLIEIQALNANDAIWNTSASNRHWRTDSKYLLLPDIGIEIDKKIASASKQRKKMWSSSRYKILTGTGVQSTHTINLGQLKTTRLLNVEVLLSSTIYIGLKSDTCLALSLTPSLILLRLAWCDSGVWRLKKNSKKF